MRFTTKIVIFVLMIATSFSCGRDAQQLSSANPLLERPYSDPYGIPPFESIKPAHYIEAFQVAYGELSDDIKAIKACTDGATFNNVILPLDSSGEMVRDLKDLFEMNSAAISDVDYQTAGDQIWGQYSAAMDSVWMDDTLFERVREVYLSDEEMTPQQRRLTDKIYERFVRGGALLDSAQKSELAHINSRIATLCNQFSANLIAANDSFVLDLDHNQVKELSYEHRTAASDEAKRRGADGRCYITLSPSSMIPFLKMSSDRELRRQLYMAYVERGEANQPIVVEVTKLRLQRAKLLGYESHADYVVSQQMAGGVSRVYSLLDCLWSASTNAAVRECKELQKIISKDIEGATLEPWDWYFYSEKLRAKVFSLTDEKVMPYFTVEATRAGLFGLINRLYGVLFRPIMAPLYHDDCVAYEVIDRDNSTLGVLYFDLYARANKGQGAWCGNLREQRYKDGKRVLPVVAVVCNFPRAVGASPAQLDLEQVRTLFHEMGHAMHFLFQDVKYRGLAAVEGDFVEFPSQFMENWAFQPELLATYALHFRTNRALTGDLLDGIADSRLFNCGFNTQLYTSSALLDIDLHSMNNTAQLDSLAAEGGVKRFERMALREQRGMISQIDPRYKLQYFPHLYTYDYSAGYYFYAWAEIFDKDAFSLFRDSKDLFSRELATKLRREILERGGEEDGLTLYRNFKGGDPDVQALLTAKGFAESGLQIDFSDNNSKKSDMESDKKMSGEQNPLLQQWGGEYVTPPFEQISVEHYEPAFDAAIAEARVELRSIVECKDAPTFENTIVALEHQGALLDRVSGVFYPLLSAETSDEMEQVSLAVQPKLTELSNDVSLNETLFKRIETLYNNKPVGLSVEDSMLLDKTYKGFVRSGAALSDDKKSRYREVTTELGRLGLEFSQNLLASTNAFSLNIVDASVAEELPEGVRQAMAEEARERGEKGWTVTLKAPSYIPFLTYSSNRALKEKLWRAYGSRSVGGERDNMEVIRKITALRLEMAQLLGYKDYAEYALDNRMAGTPEKVNEFLEEILVATKATAVEDYNNIVEYAKSQGMDSDFMPWDFAYYSEKYKDENYSLNDELVKPYLELESVRKGVFSLAERLYGIKFSDISYRKTGVERYHKDVHVYRVSDSDNELLGLLYLDFFPREGKGGGAWMTEFRNASIENGVETRPLVSLVMNFTKPTADKPSLLSFSEFETFLHEFGHSLHGLLAKGSYSSLNGANVYRDFVELPSQLLENWATEKEFLDSWAVHYQTGEKIPAELVDKIERAANYHAAYACVRQLQFGILDMAWHTITEPYEGSIEEFERNATMRTKVLPTVDGAVFSPSFSHIFGGGYAAGYYSYKWAEVLEADVYALFKERGIFDATTASSFRDNILERGGQEDPMTLYVRFRGSEPTVDALIERTLRK